MDKTIAPAREPMLSSMRELLLALPHDIIIVSGSTLEQIAFQTNKMPAYTLGIGGNHATDYTDTELWTNPPLTDDHKAEIHAHITAIKALVEHDINEDWKPIEDRGAQITFSPIGNVAPVELKHTYDPDRSKRLQWLEATPFESEDLIVKIGGSTSFDYLHKDRHKGANVARLIEHMGWDKDECVYYGDGLVPGGNDEVVIGVIDTVLVTDHLDTYGKLRERFLG